MLEVPVPEAASTARQREFDMRALERLPDSARARSNRMNAKCADRSAERKPRRGQQRDHDASRCPPRSEQIVHRRRHGDLPGGRREIAHRREQFFSLARFDPHRPGFVGQDGQRRPRTQQSREGEVLDRSRWLARDDQPGRIGQQRFARDQARIGRQHRSHGLGDRRGRLGRQRGVETAGELARAHVDLERRRLQGAHPLRVQVLARQVRQEDEEETRGDGPRDAGPRPREAPKDK